MTGTEKVLLGLTAVFLLGAIVFFPRETDRITVSAPVTEETVSETETPDTVLVLETVVDLNTASAEELCALPGIGKTAAEAIIARRETVGPFTSVEELLEIEGIGPGTLEKLLDAAK